MALDYVYKWVESIATPKVGGKIIVKFFKRNIFSHFETPRVLISDGGSHLYNSHAAKALEPCEVRHKVTSPYYLQTNGKYKISNQETKKI